MTEGCILVFYVFLALAPLVAGDDNEITMKIKSATGTGVLTVTFQENTFVQFYNYMCAGGFTQQIAKVRVLRKSLHVTELTREKARKRDNPSKYFTCLQNATSEAINCTMLFDHEGGICNDSRTECFFLRHNKGNCPCLGIRWRHPGETIFSDDSKSILRPSKNNCETIAPTMKIFISTTETASHINTSDVADDNTAQKNNLLLIVTVVVVGSIILAVIFVALLIFIHRRRHTMENYLPNACIRDQGTNMLVPESEHYFILENADSNNSNTIVEQNQFMIQNINDLESDKFRQNWRHRIAEDTDQGYVAMSNIDKTSHNGDEHYDAIVDDENSSHENVQVTVVSPVDRFGVARVCEVENDKPQGSSAEDNEYEGYNETVCRGRLPGSPAGSECKHKVQEEILYTCVTGDYALQHTADASKEHSTNMKTPCTVNSYEDVSFDNTNHKHYGNIYAVNLDISEHLKEDGNVRDDYVDANSEGRGHQGKQTNTPDLGGNAESAAVYSKLHAEVCKRANPYDVLCDGNKE
ncbi:hypothetical protein BsWGS_09344 [Bradybaena similaris]